jgi:hypothetical protein
VSEEEKVCKRTIQNLRNKFSLEPRDSASIEINSEPSQKKIYVKVKDGYRLNDCQDFHSSTERRCLLRNSPRYNSLHRKYFCDGCFQIKRMKLAKGGDSARSLNRTLIYMEDIGSLLPLEVIGEIVGYLCVPDVIRVRRVSLQWRDGAICATRLAVIPAWTDRVSFKTLRSFSVYDICSIYCFPSAFDLSE